MPRKLNVEPLIDTGCWLPLRNHEPSQRLGNTHPKKGNRMQIVIKCQHNHKCIYIPSPFPAKVGCIEAAQIAKTVSHHQEVTESALRGTTAPSRLHRVRCVVVVVVVVFVCGICSNKLFNRSQSPPSSNVVVSISKLSLNLLFTDVSFTLQVALLLFPWPIIMCSVGRQLADDGIRDGVRQR